MYRKYLYAILAVVLWLVTISVVRSNMLERYNNSLHVCCMVGKPIRFKGDSKLYVCTEIQRKI